MIMTRTGCKTKAVYTGVGATDVGKDEEARDLKGYLKYSKGGRRKAARQLGDHERLRD